ncbi:MAG: DUF2971 domain-containing protein [Sedimentisphaerales bacterium]
MKNYPTTDGNEFPTYFKYLSDDPGVINGIFLKHKIRFTQPAALNDPLEYNPQIDFGEKNTNLKQRYKYKGDILPSYNDWVRIQLIERFYNEFGVLSLTKQPLDYKMWNYYSNGHRGIVLELNENFLQSPCFLSSSRPPLEVIKVKYVEDYKIDLQNYVNGINFSFDVLIQKIIAIKTNHWEHEKEYRVVRNLAESENYRPRTQRRSFRDRSVYLFDFSLDCIKSVVFGVNTEHPIKKKIMDICCDSDIDFIQAVIVRDNGVNMSFINTSQFGSRNAFLDLKPQIFIRDAQDFKPPSLKVVNSLDEMPFYKSFRKPIREYLEKRRKRLLKLDQQAAHVVRPKGHQEAQDVSNYSHKGKNMVSAQKNNGSSAKSREDLLAELQETHQRFVQSLMVEKLHVFSISRTAKTPFKAFLIREALYYRMTDLSGAAIDLYKQNKIIPAIIIIRAAYETAALCFYVYKNLNQAIEKHNFIEIDDFLMRAGHGGKLDEVHYKAFNTLTVIGHLDKQFQGLERMYAWLCEFAHPNWPGCEGAYSTLNAEEHYVEFSLKKKSIPPEVVGLNELSVALVVFENYYNKMEEILPEVIKLCEEGIAKRMTKFRSLAGTFPPEKKLALFYEVEQSKTWAICFEGEGIIVASCAIDESDTPQLTDDHNEYLKALINEEDKLVFVTDNNDS